MNNINLAIVGFGRTGKIHASNILASENINLKIIIDPILDINEKFTSIGISQSKEINDLLNLDNIDGLFVDPSVEISNTEQFTLVSDRSGCLYESL